MGIRHYRQSKISSEPKRTQDAFVSCDTPLLPFSQTSASLFTVWKPICMTFMFLVRIISDDFIVSIMTLSND